MVPLPWPLYSPLHVRTLKKNLITFDESQQQISRCNTINLLRASEPQSCLLWADDKSLVLASFDRNHIARSGRFCCVLQNRYLYRPSDVRVDLHTSPRTASLRLFIGNRFLYTLACSPTKKKKTDGKFTIDPQWKSFFKGHQCCFLCWLHSIGSLTWYESIKPATFLDKYIHKEHSLPTAYKDDLALGLLRCYSPFLSCLCVLKMRLDWQS
jgi:hypothetical protein